MIWEDSRLVEALSGVAYCVAGSKRLKERCSMTIKGSMHCNRSAVETCRRCLRFCCNSNSDNSVSISHITVASVHRHSANYPRSLCRPHLHACVQRRRVELRLPLAHQISHRHVQHGVNLQRSTTNTRRVTTKKRTHLTLSRVGCVHHHPTPRCRCVGHGRCDTDGRTSQGRPNHAVNQPMLLN